MTWTDSHAHIYVDEFRDDREAMLSRARSAGVAGIYMPNVDKTTIEGMLRVEEQNADCFAMMGLHPCSVKKDFQKQLYEVEAWLSKRAFAAVGETGTDLYWDKTFWEQQREALIVQAGWAKKFRLPLIIHCRESMDETLEILRPLADENLRGIFHCFTGTIEQGRSIVDLGFCLGIGGVATFKNGGLDRVLPSLGADSIIMETDSPYLAPVPYRGKRNEPSYVPLIADRVAAILGVTRQELMEKTERNAEKIFPKPGPFRK